MSVVPVMRALEARGVTAWREGDRILGGDCYEVGAPIKLVSADEAGGRVSRVNYFCRSAKVIVAHHTNTPMVQNRHD